MAVDRPGPETESTIDVKASDLEYWVDQIETIIQFFEARDEMNARVHLDGVRFSPITIRTQELREYLNELWQAAVADLVRQ